MTVPERRLIRAIQAMTSGRLIEPLVPKVKHGGRPAEYERREIVNAILYVLRSGCAWRMMPHDLPYWENAYAYFRML